MNGLLLGISAALVDSEAAENRVRRCRNINVDAQAMEFGVQTDTLPADLLIQEVVGQFENN